MAKEDRKGESGEQKADVASDILASGLHEIRRPLALARGYVEMLTTESTGPLNQAQHTAAGRIEEKLIEAQARLEQLDVAARLGGDGADLRDLVVNEAVHDAVDRARAKAELEGGSVAVSEGVPVRARADPKLLARILDNLIHNALTYSDREPQVRIEVGRDDGPYVRVADRGRGLDADAAARAFTKGFRGDPGDSSRPGTGLGLYLSREAAQQMGGALELERTAPGAGSTFRLQLARGGGLEVLNGSGPG